MEGEKGESRNFRETQPDLEKVPEDYQTKKPCKLKTYEKA